MEDNIACGVQVTGLIGVAVPQEQLRRRTKAMCKEQKPAMAKKTTPLPMHTIQRIVLVENDAVL